MITDKSFQTFFRILNLLKLLRLVRLVRLFRYLDSHLPISKQMVGIVKLLFMLFIVLHWIACLWFFASLENPERDASDAK